MPAHGGAHDLDADSSAAQQRLTAQVRGRVQGGGYRDFCRRAARTIARDARKSGNARRPKKSSSSAK